MITDVEPVIVKELTTEAWQEPLRDSAHDKWLHSWRGENLLAGGRGTRKTSYLLYKNAFQACYLNAGPFESILTEQVDKKVDEILLPRQRKFINPDLYRVVGGRGSRDLLWLAPHGRGYGPEHGGHITRLRGRQATRRHDDPPFHGLDAGYVGHDEIARDKDPVSEDLDPIVVSMACQRDCAGRVKAQDYTTTTNANWFYDHCLDLGIADNDQDEQRSADGRASAFYTATEDVDPALYDRLRGRMSKELADQMLRARWVALSGRVWPGYVGDQMWPHGNRHWATFDPDRPWAITADLGGAESAWAIIQYFDAVDQQGKVRFNERLAVAVAEWIPDQLGSFMVIPMIRDYIAEHEAKYPHPWCSITGHDIKTPGPRGDAAFVDYVAAGWDADLRKPTGVFVDKKVQHRAVNRMLCDDFGKRRLCVSDKIQTFHPNNRGGRGLHNMLNNFQMPERGSSAYWRKGPSQDPGGFCHMADAIAYGITCLHGRECILEEAA